MSGASSSRAMRLLLQRAAGPLQASSTSAGPIMQSCLTAVAAQQQQLGAATGSGWANGPSSRSISTSRAPLMSVALADVLSQELNYEKKEYKKPEAVAKGPPAPFTLSEAPGDTLLTLSRTFQNEQISVDLHVNNQPAAEQSDMDDVAADADEEELNTVLFNVHVTKGDNSLVFECESDGTFVAINHVSYEPKDGIESESTYTGPVFDELDDQLQAEFRTYLEHRGITTELGEYLRHLVYDKEVREYMRWLECVAEFVKK